MAFAIYLNGTSSAGKTTLCRALQEKCEEPLFTTGIDLLIRQILPHKFGLAGDSAEDFLWRQEIDSTGVSVPRVRMGPRGQKSYRMLIQASCALLDGGINVVIDDVAIMGQWQTDLWKVALQPYSSLFVGVRCPLHIIEARERERGDRPLRSARGQYEIVHAGTRYDLEIDTSQESTDESVARILSYQRNPPKLLMRPDE